MKPRTEVLIAICATAALFSYATYCYNHPLLRYKSEHVSLHDLPKPHNFSYAFDYAEKAESRDAILYIFNE